MEAAQYIEVAANVATAMSLIVAVAILGLEKRRERIDREYGTYDALDEKYIEFLRICIDNPDLNIYHNYASSSIKLDTEQKMKRAAAFEILVSVLERAYLMYHEKRSSVMERQWAGWEAYIEGWARDPRFVEVWQTLGDQYEQQFCRHINSLISGGKLETDTDRAT